MCLERVFTKKEREKVLAKLPEEFTVWKVIVDDVDWNKYEDECRYTTDCRWLPIHAGEMKFVANIIYDRSRNIRYRGGGHFWLHKKDADEWKWADFERVIRCRIKKEWITNMGEQRDGIVIVVKKAVFPKYIGQTDLVK